MQGADQAQSAAATWNTVTQALALLGNPVFGGWSDTVGRRPVIVLAVLTNLLPGLVFWGTLHQTSWSPIWYNVSVGNL